MSSCGKKEVLSSLLWIGSKVVSFWGGLRKESSCELGWTSVGVNTSQKFNLLTAIQQSSGELGKCYKKPICTDQLLEVHKRQRRWVLIRKNYKHELMTQMWQHWEAKVKWGKWCVHFGCCCSPLASCNTWFILLKMTAK